MTARVQACKSPPHQQELLQHCKGAGGGRRAGTAQAALASPIKQVSPRHCPGTADGRLSNKLIDTNHQGKGHRRCKGATL
eukprot:1161392-Pelagomonas_calceolata.AAC.21